MGLVGLGALSSCGGGDDETADKNRSDKQEESGGPTRQGGGAAPTTAPPVGSAKSYVATAAVPAVEVFSETNAGEPSHTFSNPWDNGTPLVFLLDGNQVAGEWLPVYVPAKPNGSKGFVRATDVTVAPNPYWVRIEQGAHRIVVTKNDEVIVDDQVGLGDASAEWDTPNGLFFIKELIDSTNPAYGPYAYGLSAFTENEALLEQFPDGVVGLHGTNEPDSIGKSVSHGCIRVRNDVITELAGLLPLGTPVEIVA